MTAQEDAATHEIGAGGVDGERGTTLVRRGLSIHSRISSLLAVIFMCAMGAGALVWYYGHLASRQSGSRQTAQAAAAKRAQGDTVLPSLGHIEYPPAAPPLPDPESRTGPLTESSAPLPKTLVEIPLAASAAPPALGEPAQKSPAQLMLERQLSGAVFSAQAQGAYPMLAAAAPGAAAMPVASQGPPGAGASVQEPGDLPALLKPSMATAVQAQVLPAQRLLLPRGSFIDCTLETAIDSTLPGMTTCVMATDAFGVDGKVVLLDRGTKLIGETRGQVQQGSARVFVLWTEARTPQGVIVPLASPGADELGRSGLPGEVNRHFFERFGAALLVSIIDGAVEAAVQSASHGNGSTVVVNPSASQGVLTEVLKNTINIPPTVTKRNGDRIQVLVARDLDFRSVYELRSVPPVR